MNNKFITLLSNPLLNGWGFIVGLIGMAFAIFTYFDSQSYPELVAQVHPTKTVLVSEQGVQELAIYADGKKVDGPVTSVQIAIWNNGKKEVKAEDVLESIVLKTNKKVKILSAKVLKQSRNVVNLNLNSEKSNEGVIGLNFRIFEKSDSALLQVTYEGKDDIEFVGYGSLIGQKSFMVSKFNRVLSSKENSDSKSLHSKYVENTFYIFTLTYVFFLLIKMIPSIFDRSIKLKEILNSDSAVMKKIAEVADYIFGIFLFMLLTGLLYVIVELIREVKSPYIYG